MADHYIKVDAYGRIIEGYTTADHSPDVGDIFLHSGGDNFSLFGRGMTEISFDANGTVIWLFAYDDGKVRYRTPDEIDADLPYVEPQKTIGERLNEHESDIATLAEAINIMLGVSS